MKSGSTPGCTDNSGWDVVGFHVSPEGILTCRTLHEDEGRWFELPGEPEWHSSGRHRSARWTVALRDREGPA